MLSGIGIDMVRNGRVKNLIDRWEGKFLRKIFTSEEIEGMAECRLQQH